MNFNGSSGRYSPSRIGWFKIDYIFKNYLFKNYALNNLRILDFGKYLLWFVIFKI